MKKSTKLTEKRKTRIEYVDDYLLSSGHVQPSLKKTDPFYKAMRKLLLELPDIIFDYVQKEIWFVIENSSILNFAFYNQKICHNLKLFPKKVRIYTIVLFHDYLKFSQQALIGLIADNLAVYFRTFHETGKTLYKSEAEIVDEWGFSINVEAFNKELNVRND